MHATPYGTSVKGFRDAAAPRFIRLDVPLLAATLALIGLSIYTISTATQGDIAGQPWYYVHRQAAYGGVGIALMLILSRIDYSRMREWKAGLYLAMIGLIVLVFALGTAARGSRRALDLGFFQLQTSELGKVLLILTLAAFMVDRTRRLGERETTSRIMLLALLPAMLVIAQPDLGSGLVYMAIVIAVLFVGGTKWTHFAALGGLAAFAVVAAVVLAPAAGVELLKPYQMDRLTAFVNPAENPAEEGYQQTQSLVAIGAGGRTGRGEDATQTRLDFLPEHHTDFVFAVVGEEFGFGGAALVLSLFALMIWRCLRILTMSKNLYGTLIAGGVTAMLMFQIFVNVGMTIGIMPITGVTLPLMSYGGSSVIVTFLALGLMQSIHAQARETTLSKGREL